LAGALYLIASGQADFSLAAGLVAQVVLTFMFLLVVLDGPAEGPLVEAPVPRSSVSQLR